METSATFEGRSVPPFYRTDVATRRALFHNNAAHFYRLALGTRSELCRLVEMEG